MFVNTEYSEALRRTMPDSHEPHIKNSKSSEMAALYHFETTQHNYEMSIVAAVRGDKLHLARYIIRKVIPVSPVARTPALFSGVVECVSNCLPLCVPQPGHLAADAGLGEQV